jgi:hypothetical protein
MPAQKSKCRVFLHRGQNGVCILRFESLFSIAATFVLRGMTNPQTTTTGFFKRQVRAVGSAIWE